MHAGVMVAEGQGVIYVSSTKNKLNTTDSTKLAIVSMGEKVDHVVHEVPCSTGRRRSTGLANGLQEGN